MFSCYIVNNDVQRGGGLN